MSRVAWSGTFVNAEVQSATHEMFEIPPARVRHTLERGMQAKVIFTVAEGDKHRTPFSGGERMWVTITGHTPDGRYEGVLDNDPAVLDLKCGHPLRFGPEHIIDVGDALS